MELRKYVPALVTFLLTVGHVLLFQGFLTTNLNVSGTPFETTLVLSVMALVSAVISFIGSIPRLGKFLIDEKVSYKAYTVIIVVLIVLSLLLAGATVMMGSIEYTQFNASM